MKDKGPAKGQTKLFFVHATSFKPFLEQKIEKTKQGGRAET